MRKSLLFLFAICLFGASALEARAQAGPPPKVLSIFREEIKAGRGAAHVKIEVGYVRALQRARWPVYSLAMTPAVGGTDAWFMTAYDSFAAMEQDRSNMDKNAQLSADFERLDAMDAEFRTGQRSLVCSQIEALSWGPNFDVSQMRYFSVTTVRVRPGRDEEYREARRLIGEAVKKANPNARSVLYVVTAGMPGGTYLIFTPRKSLAELDPNPAVGRAVQEALGEENAKKRQKLLADSVISTDTSIYAFSPRMSYVPKEWAKTGGEFWTPKPPPMPRPLAKKPADGETK
ncbi:MAG TPA: hypothetical protein VLE20_00680 [Blastocatellia bacterium]|nr:hypothetical protein [Blastocatellia bacterium]